MKDKTEDGVLDLDEAEIRRIYFEFQLQKQRIEKIIAETIYKLRLLTHLPALLKQDGAVLRSFLTKTEVDFIVLVCTEQTSFSKLGIENRPDLLLICDMLEKINLHEGKGSVAKKRTRIFGTDQFDVHIAYAIDIIFKCRPLLAHIEQMDDTPDPLMTAFINSMIQFEGIVAERLNFSALEEIKKDNDLKNAFRASIMLSDNIQELEELLEKQRNELNLEHERKEQILEDLVDKIDKLREKSKAEINRVIYESEVSMMKDYIKSSEKQELFAEEAAKATREYEELLEEHLAKEKVLRGKRLKVETQLASWVAKYDQDVGDKQAEFDDLELKYNEEKHELDTLQELFDDQEEEYLSLMKEKEEEEQRIMEEKGWIFLQNRAARRIQRAWRAYRARKLAKKKGKKGKKKGEKKGSAGSKRGGSAGSNKGKGKTSPKDAKPEKPAPKGPDPNALLESKFKGSILDEVKSKEAFEQKDVVVDLMND